MPKSTYLQWHKMFSKEAYENKNRHYFFIPKEARWSVLSNTAENIGEMIDKSNNIGPPNDGSNSESSVMVVKNFVALVITTRIMNFSPVGKLITANQWIAICFSQDIIKP